MPLVFGRSILGFGVVAGPPASTWTDPDLTYGSYDSVSFSISTQETSPVELTFNDDGSKMYVMGFYSRTIYQYSLSTEFDVSTASYDSVSFSVASELSQAGGFVFNNDGTKLYATGEGGDVIFQYSLSTAYDISTASYDSVTLDVSSQEAGPNAIEISTDGTKMYIIGWQYDKVFQYTLTSAFDLSTASYANKSFSVTGESSPFALRFNPNGTKMYVVGTSQDKVRQYSLSTAFDVSTASYDTIAFDVNPQESLPHAMAFKNDGSKLYILGHTNDTVYQYSTVAPAWSADLSSASYDSVSFSVTSQESTSPVGLAFNNNGTKMYMLGASSDTIFQYSLSTAFDVSTASYDSVSFSVQAQDTNSFNLIFNNNGTKMYMVGATGDSVYQYSLSTSFDLSTASYDSVSFSVASQDITPYDVAFDSSGTKMYIVGFNNDTLYQYSLSTAYDLSTASYDSVSFSVASQEIQPTDFAISSDGTEIYVVGLANDTVYKYTLSTAWDLSTASYSNVSFSVASQETLPRSVTFNSSGSKMYILGSTNKSIFQYST